MVAAFRMPEQKPSQAILLATHTDSPCLKLKPIPEIIGQEIGEIGTEIYGGPLLHTWLDRDLEISGKISYLTKEGKLASQLIRLNNTPLIIPNLAIHLDRTINDKGVMIHKHDHLKAVFSLKGKEKTLEKLIEAQVPFQKLLSFDLFLTPTQPPSLIGCDKELIAAYRIDNLSSAYAACEAIALTKKRAQTLQMALFWDHEEIGSVSSEGADSIFIPSLLERICQTHKMDSEDRFRLMSRSLCLSSDVAHGFHPHFPEKYDPQNAPYLGKGVVLKFSSKYATTGSTAAPIVALCDRYKITHQVFASRSDVPSGSTVGSMMAATTGIPTLDLGIACWAMHSTRETMALVDQVSLNTLLQKALDEEVSTEEALT